MSAKNSRVSGRPTEGDGRSPAITVDGELDGRLANDGVVVERRSVTLGRAHRAFVARFVEVRLRHKDQGLDRDHHLKQRRHIRVPLLALRALPRAQQREADLAAVVEIRVEANSAAARSEQQHLRRRGRIGRPAHDVKDEAPALVGCVLLRSNAAAVSCAQRARWTSQDAPGQ